MRTLIAEKFYLLTPLTTSESGERVLGPFEDHRAAWIARCGWAYDSCDMPDRAELLTGAELAQDYGGRHGVLH